MLNKTLLRFGFVFFFFLITCYIVGNNLQAQSKKMNWGLRMGLNAVSITSYEAYQADELLANSSYTNKNGYLITGFARFNLNRIFMQPELAWDNYRRTCSFSLPVENSDNYYPPVNLDMNSRAINTNFLVGYNIVHDYPFLFGVFTGVSFIGTYRTDFSTESVNSFSKTGLSVNYSGILGFSINISRIYFDMRYEMSLPNANMALNAISEYQDVMIKKTEAVLSFSFGVMF